MFTVRFFDVLTGAHAVSHPVEHNRAHANKLHLLDLLAGLSVASHS